MEPHERLAGWARDYAAWAKRDLSDRRYAYWWADAVKLRSHSSDNGNHRVLTIFGVRMDGTKALVSLTRGTHTSRASWLDVLRDLRSRGLEQGPMLATSAGAMAGLWAALDEIYPQTRHQHCWMKTGMAVLRALPKALQSKTKAELSVIWSATSRDEAQGALASFVARHQADHPKAAAILARDPDALLAYYDFPAEHWHHLRATHPIESTFASVRHSIAHTKSCVPQAYSLGLTFRLVQESEKTWRRIRSPGRITEMLAGTVFKDGKPLDSATV